MPIRYLACWTESHCQDDHISEIMLKLTEHVGSNNITAAPLLSTPGLEFIYELLTFALCHNSEFIMAWGTHTTVGFCFENDETYLIFCDF